eukprot:3765497-Rhodomonas_salina.2
MGKREEGDGQSARLEACMHGLRTGQNHQPGTRVHAILVTPRSIVRTLSVVHACMQVPAFAASAAHRSILRTAWGQHTLGQHSSILCQYCTVVAHRTAAAYTAR